MKPEWARYLTATEFFIWHESEPIVLLPWAGYWRSNARRKYADRREESDRRIALKETRPKR